MVKLLEICLMMILPTLFVGLLTVQKNWNKYLIYLAMTEVFTIFIISIRFFFKVING